MSTRKYTVKLKRPNSSVPFEEVVDNCVTMQEAIIRAESRTGCKCIVAWPS